MRIRREGTRRDFFRPAHAGARNAYGGACAFVAKGKQSTATTDRNRRTRLGKIQPESPENRNSPMKPKSHMESLLREVSVFSKLALDRRSADFRVKESFIQAKQNPKLRNQLLPIRPFVFFLAPFLMVGCSQHGAERSEFSRFPAAKTTTAPLQKIDWESHPQARSYRTRLKELIGSKADFAGHYIILEIGAGTMASQIFLVDVENGKVYLAPFVACLGVKYALNSRLLLENDPDAVQDYVQGLEGKRPEWLRVKTWIWSEEQKEMIPLP